MVSRSVARTRARYIAESSFSRPRDGFSRIRSLHAGGARQWPPQQPQPHLSLTNAGVVVQDLGTTCLTRRFASVLISGMYSSSLERWAPKPNRHAKQVAPLASRPQPE